MQIDTGISTSNSECTKTLIAHSLYYVKFPSKINNLRLVRRKPGMKKSDMKKIEKSGKVFPQMPPLILGETRSGKTSVRIMVIDKAISSEKK